MTYLQQLFERVLIRWSQSSVRSDFRLSFVAERQTDKPGYPQDEQQRTSWIALDIDVEFSPGWLTLGGLVMFLWHETRIQIYARVDKRFAHLFMRHYLLLSRNLLYTGLTRARQLAILVGPPKSIGFAVKRMLDRQRYTALADRLKQ